MTPKGHAIPSKTQLLSYGTPALPRRFFHMDPIYSAWSLLPIRQAKRSF